MPRPKTSLSVAPNKRLKLTGADRSRGAGVLCAGAHELLLVIALTLAGRGRALAQATPTRSLADSCLPESEFQLRGVFLATDTGGTLATLGRILRVRTDSGVIQILRWPWCGERSTGLPPARTSSPPRQG